MDQTTANYYRSILFGDITNQTALPPTLVLLHAWAFKRYQAMGASSSVIAKQAALSVAMTWLSSTKEGRAFALEHTTIGEMFCADDDQPIVAGAVDWKEIPVSTPVVAIVDKQKTVGEYMGRRSGYIDMLVAGEKKTFRTNQVQLAGV
jgi:hypothetical protein